ncbi:hypothetical protein Tco_1581290, partial [Tanacetum coccineum]
SDTALYPAGSAVGDGNSAEMISSICAWGSPRQWSLPAWVAPKTWFLVRSSNNSVSFSLNTLVPTSGRSWALWPRMYASISLISSDFGLEVNVMNMSGLPYARHKAIAS